jgi:hypothetical protein
VNSAKKVLTLGIITRRFRSFASIQIFPGALVAQSVERFLGKEEVGGSNPLEGSIQVNLHTSPPVKEAHKALNII